MAAEFQWYNFKPIDLIKNVENAIVFFDSKSLKFDNFSIASWKQEMHEKP